MSSAHAAARVEQQPDVHLGTALEVGASREVFKRLLLTVLDDLEILGVQISKVLALPVDDGHAEGGEVDPGAERRRLRGDPGHANRDAGRQQEEKQALPHRTSRSYTRSEATVHRDSSRLRPSPTIGSRCADAVRPLDRQKRPERSARFDARADAWINARRRSPTGIVHHRGVAKRVDADAAPRPRRCTPHDRASVIADRRGRVTMQLIVKAVEAVPAEAIQVVTRHPRHFDARAH